MEFFMDIVDQAQDENERLNLSAVVRFKGRLKEPVSSAFCVICGDEIPEKRRQAVVGCQLCVGCQRFEEARR